jgi:hypothetical protein
VAESHNVLRGSKPGHLNSVDCIFRLRCILVALYVFCPANVHCCGTFFVIYASALFVPTSLTPTCSGTHILTTFQLLSNDHGRRSCPPPKLISKARSLKSHSKPCNDHTRVLSSAVTNFLVHSHYFQTGASRTLRIQNASEKSGGCMTTAATGSQRIFEGPTLCS